MLFSKFIVSGLMAAGLSFAAPAADVADIAVREAQEPTASLSFATPTGSRTRAPRPTGSYTGTHTRGPRPTGSFTGTFTGTRTRRPRPTGSATLTGSPALPTGITIPTEIPEVE